MTDDVLWPNESIYKSTRDDNNENENIPTLRVNVEEKTFVPLQSVMVEAWIHTFAADVTLTQTFINLEDNPGHSCPVVNDRKPMIYEEKRQPLKVTVYDSHILCFTAYYDHRKQ